MKTVFLSTVAVVLSLFPQNLTANLPEPMRNKNSLSFDNLKSYIRKHEGLRLKPYKCAGSHNTIGYGKITKDSVSHITLEFAEKLLEIDAFEAYMIAVRDGFRYEKAYAVTHFIYALGCGAWIKSKLRKLIKQNAPISKIKKEWLRWVHINGTPHKSLIDMRTHEFMWFQI